MAFEDYLQHRRSLIRLSGTVKSYSKQLALALPRNNVDDFAGALRETLPGFIEGFGAAAGALGADYYNTLRVKSGVSGRFTPTIAPIQSRTATGVAVGFMAKTFIEKQGNIGELQTNLADELQRSVLSVERRTIYNNSINDSGVTLYQRVAAADACEFCAMVAFEPTLTREYPTEFHRNCYCTAEPVFRGQQAIRPDYYDQFSEEYSEAVSNLDPLDRSTKNILAEVRGIRGEQDAEADARSLVDAT